VKFVHWSINGDLAFNSVVPTSVCFRVD
jgi:hypothetical protein